MDSAIHPQKGEALRDQLCGYQNADLGFHFLFLFIYSIFFFYFFFFFFVSFWLSCEGQMISILSQHSSVIRDLRRLKIMTKRNQNVVKYLSLKY